MSLSLHGMMVWQYIS